MLEQWTLFITDSPWLEPCCSYTALVSDVLLEQWTLHYKERVSRTMVLFSDPLDVLLEQWTLFIAESPWLEAYSSCTVLVSIFQHACKCNENNINKINRTGLSAIQNSVDDNDNYTVSDHKIKSRPTSAISVHP